MDTARPLTSTLPLASTSPPTVMSERVVRVVKVAPSVQDAELPFVVKRNVDALVWSGKAPSTNRFQ